MIDFVAIPEEQMRKLRINSKLLKKLESLTDAKIRLSEEVEIDCEDPMKLMRTMAVIKAFGRGFGFEDALLLLDDEYELRIIDIKDFGKSSRRMEDLRGRVIGRAGKAKDIIEKLANVKLSIYGKTISIIGNWSSVQVASEAICMLLGGSKHGSVYRFLEENIKRTR